MPPREILDGLPLVGGHPAIDFVNTWLSTAKRDYLGSLSAAVVWFETLGLIAPAEATAILRHADDSAQAIQVVAGLQDLREVLHALIYAIADGQPAEPALMERFRRLHADSVAHLDLCWVDGEGRFALEVARDDPRLMLWRMARLGADLVTARHHGRLRSCARRPNCDWVFLDTSKSGRRRWCTAHICGNRIRLQRFLSRKATGE